MTARARRDSSRAARPGPAPLGWREWAGLPDLGVRRIKVKLDTGARTSSLHAFRLRRFTRDGRPMVRFEVHPVQRSTAAAVSAEAEVVGERTVRSSGGHEEARPVIHTDVRLGGERWTIELTLSRRDDMGFRMLLGRQALRGRACVDPARSFVAGEREGRAGGARRNGAPGGPRRLGSAAGAGGSEAPGGEEE